MQAQPLSETLEQLPGLCEKVIWTDFRVLILIFEGTSLQLGLGHAAGVRKLHF